MTFPDTTFTTGTTITSNWLNAVNDACLDAALNVKAFGAVGDGVTDDTAAIIAANASAGTGTLVFPVGTYLISSSVTLTANIVILGGTLLKITGGTFAFGAGAINEIKPEWFYFGSGYQTAISQALTIQRNSVNAALGMSTYGRIIPVVLEPNKPYVISGTITATDYTTIIGNSASIQTASAYPYDHSYPIINGIGYQPTFENITFLGGNNVLVFPENNQGYDIIIKDCKFTEWKGVAIYGSSVPHAQHLICNDCEFTARSVDSTICDIAWDKAVMKDCQYSGPSTTKFINRDSLVLEDWVCSPQPPSGGESWSSDPCWILNEGLELVVSRFRFGGEPGAHRILQNEMGTTFQGGATTVAITECAIYTGGDYLMVLNASPANFVFEGNYGFSGTAGILYGADSTSSDNLNIGRTQVDFNPGVWGSSRLAYGSLSSANNSKIINRLATVMNKEKQLGTQTITTATKVADLVYGSMSGATNPNFTVTTTTDIFGATVQKITGYNGDNSFNSYAYFQNAVMTGLPAGIYTAVVNVTTQGNPVSFGIVGSLTEKFINLTGGNHTLSVEFYWDGTNNPYVGYSFYNVDASTYFTHNGFRLFEGSVNMPTWETVTYGTAAPTTGYHRKGDRVIQQTPTVGQPKGWVCTASGTPGTWVSLGNL